MIWVAAFYQFRAVIDPQALQVALADRCAQLGLKGTILVAPEGVNGTVTGDQLALERLVDDLIDVHGFCDLPVKYSRAKPDNKVFHRLKVRVKPEIVSFGVPQVQPGQRTGQHVDPQRFNELLADPQVTVIDVRNTYETQIGGFPGAVDPRTTNFRDFPDYVTKALNPNEQTRVAMYCTGGIRCEKASAYLLEQGFDEVYQLDGGILNYLEQIEDDNNHWQGECFVFDQRVSVDADLAQGSYLQCFACRRPLGAAELEHPDYVEGVSCPNCVAQTSDVQRAGYAERHRQAQLAQSRGDNHIGGAALSPRSASET